MIDVEYPNGPWKKLFFGDYDEYSLSLYFNQEGFIISEILNREKTKIVLYISQIIGIFGDAETFVETIPRNAIFLLQHGTKSNQKYLFLLGDQEVLNYVQKDISDFVNDQFKKLKKDAKGIINIASSYEINLKDYSELPLDMKTTLFSNPLGLFSFVTQNRQPKIFSGAKQQFNQKDFFLGFYKATNEKVNEPIDIFDTTFLFGPNSEKCMRVLIENFALNKENTLVFTYDDSLMSIKYPNENPEVQEKNQNASIGFPVVAYNIGDKICVNLSDLPNNSFQELLEIKSKIIFDLIGFVLKEKQPATIDNLIKDLEELQPNGEYTSYNINLVQRIVNLTKLQYPGVFLGDFSVSDFFKNLGSNYGSVNIIKLDKKNKQVNRVIVYNVLKKVVEFSGSDAKIALFFPNLSNLFSRTDKDSLVAGFYDLLSQCKNQLVFAASVEVDLDSQLLNKSTAKLSLLENDEIGISIKDSKPFRFILRPTYSKV
ncbi:MAG: hypothetical protein COT14_03135 [Candidatus Diapherotrites archaeon CG08_land_8_20_14_0_20_30_16]|nr:MAG: hypothetical protein COT14_03135 [Candidatus Diapherotrites archaeon CG08_land_8_20_14_0_20_30_16]